LKIAVFGTGYVGLVAGACFADAGNHVIGVDIDTNKIKMLQEGKSPIYEPGLDDILESALAHKRIEFTTDKEKAIKEASVIFIAVGTPEGEDGSADLTHVLNVADEIATHMRDEKVIVMKSTVPVGTAEKVEALMKSKTKVKYHIVSNPEFLKEGASITDFLKPDRVVIGCTTEHARNVMGELYSPFIKANNHPILFMSNKAAELTKYAANAFLATKISFINELAQLADSVGCDVNDVKRGFTTDARINPAFFYPGVGYGGSCFPKDVKALIKTAETFDLPMDVVRGTDRVNEKQKSILPAKIKNHFKGKLQGLKFALWGLSFKPRTDDVREAPAYVIIDELLSAGASIVAYDPAAMPNTKRHFGNKIQLAEESLDALKGADALIVATEWNEFRTPDFAQLSSLMKQKIIFDGRNVYEPSKVREHGFTYYCIGRDHA